MQYKSSADSEKSQLDSEGGFTLQCEQCCDVCNVSNLDNYLNQTVKQILNRHAKLETQNSRELYHTPVCMKQLINSCYYCTSFRLHLPTTNAG